MFLATVRFLLILAIVTGSGCGTSKIKSARSNESMHTIRTLAVSVHGGVLGEALTRQLRMSGYTALDSASVYELQKRIGISEIDEKTQESLRRLRTGGAIDAYITVDPIVSPATGHPNSAKVAVFSTHTGKRLFSIDWTNGWGGLPGSIADHIAKENADEAAVEIARELTANLASVAK